MKINKLNVNQICQVKSFIKATHNLYEYRKNRKVLWLFPIEDGFYYLGESFTPTIRAKEVIEKLDDRLYVEGENVYFHPHLEITMTNGDVHTKYFKTEQELREFMESDVMKGIKFIDK